MRILVTEKGTTARTLRDTLLSKRLSSEQTDAAFEELAAANPHVDLEALKPGMTLFVPDTPVFASQAGDSVAGQALTDFERLARSALEAAASRSRTAAETRAADTAELSKLLKSAGFKRMVEQDAELQRAVDAANASLKQDKQDADQAQQILAGAVKDAMVAVRAFGEILNG